MKKILTLLIATVAFVAVQAQNSKEEARRVILGGGNGGGNTYPSGGNRDVILGGGNDERSYPDNYPSGDRQNRVEQINREYDAKIQSIRNNQYLSYEEKQRAIRQLEKDRQKRIQQINSSYKNDNYNNGKHKGWNKKNKNKNWKKGKRDRDDD